VPFKETNMLLRRFAGPTLSLMVLGATLLCLVSCGGGTGGTSDGDNDGKLDFLIGASGRQAPEFTLETIGGEQVTLSALNGQVRLIDFWATWCAPCREEVPMFKELYATYASQGFTIVAIAAEGADAVREFVESNGIEYPNLVDPDEIVSDLYEVPALPSAYLVDREGRIVEEFVGPKPRRILEKKIVELLEAKPAT
jgi:peroxiredoxin